MKTNDYVKYKAWWLISNLEPNAQGYVDGDFEDEDEYTRYLISEEIHKIFKTFKNKVKKLRNERV